MDFVISGFRVKHVKKINKKIQVHFFFKCKKQNKISKCLTQKPEMTKSKKKKKKKYKSIFFLIYSPLSVGLICHFHRDPSHWDPGHQYPTGINFHPTGIWSSHWDLIIPLGSHRDPGGFPVWFSVGWTPNLDCCHF